MPMTPPTPIGCDLLTVQQNVSAFQFEGEIFYRTIKSVYPGTELLVWYGDQYASKLGISVDAEGESARFEGGGYSILPPPKYQYKNTQTTTKHNKNII